MSPDERFAVTADILKLYSSEIRADMINPDPMPVRLLSLGEPSTPSAQRSCAD
jgi:hypothetical protein